MTVVDTYGIIISGDIMDIKTASGLSYGRGYVYRIQYHIVWCVKYRRKVLVGSVETDLKKEISLVATELGFSIDVMECMPDHIHLLISCTPQHFIPTLVKIMKGNSVRHLFMSHPEIKNALWDRHLWNPSYFVATVSDNTTEQISEYINKQKEK